MEWKYKKIQDRVISEYRNSPNYHTIDYWIKKAIRDILKEVKKNSKKND